MVSRKTLERYIQQLDEVISSGNTAVAKELQNEIIAVLSADLDGLKKGLTNYSAVGAFSDSRTGKTIVVGDELDFIKDAKMLKSRLLMELDKMDEKDMSSILHASPQEKLTLCKKGGSTVSVIAQVDGDKRYSSDAHVIIEEGDVFERHLPNGAKEYYRATDRGFYKGNHGIPDNYQSKVEIVSEGIAVHKMTEEQDEKPHKLFISHSSKDREYMAALVDMLERIGMPGGSFVCTSVPGHGIPEGASIFDWLRKQFLECDLRVVFALSHNYYSSAASLNEMGAAWVTKATDTLLLLPGFEFDEIKGCIDPQKVGISFGMDDDELKHRLNEFKDELVSEHHLQSITQIRWEQHRDKFVKMVREIAAKKETMM